ncbi:putative peptide zinc metalloprotease protein [Chryseobacterium defluvii]|uniref:Putative peptide zinc metalloprotease protein n=1 Tax=Chryseobacterium defluvii TaxID=160396 RepID=A0A840K9A7_9FLAO|nr:peptidase, M50 family protein [Chryseobacterium defluvii]MBB4806051.1 putative peptide zinc metalloprotease protein [Chryseobacterium defluvii]
MLEEKTNNRIPELSDNLHFNKLSENDYILSNSDHRHYVKINTEVYHLLSLINGKKCIEEITDEYNKSYNAALDAEKVYLLLYEKLVVYGILKGHNEKIKEYEKPSYLTLSFIIINEKLLSRIVKKFYFLFHKKKAFYILFFCLLVMSVILYFNFDLYKSFQLNQSLIYFFMIMTISVTFHEIGHATSASFFGAKHGGIGGGFYLLTPVYFADVTDIWRLNKTQRIVVNLSGMYFELVICTLFSIISLIFNNYTLLIISVIVCLKTLFNLNPFLRSDGYWVVSDLTNKPNLLYHSSEKLKDIFRLIFKGKKTQWKRTDYILLLYGMISYSFIIFFLYYVLIKNPNSIIHFPENLYGFFENLFKKDSHISLVQYGELIVPIMFFLLLYRFIKSLLKR